MPQVHTDKTHHPAMTEFVEVVPDLLRLRTPPSHFENERDDLGCHVGV